MVVWGIKGKLETAATKFATKQPFMKPNG